MRSHTGKAAFLFLGLVVALGGLGVGYAAWTDSIRIQGSIETATIDWEVSDPSFSLEFLPQSETAWALYDGEGSFDCGHGWGRHFRYEIGAAALVAPFMAGQHIPVGTVTVSTVGGNLTVEYNTTGSGWAMGISHLYVGTHPPTKCAPGKFPYRSDADNKPPADTEYSKNISAYVHRYSIPLSTIGVAVPDDVYIAAHAVVTGPQGGGSSSVSAFDKTVTVQLNNVPAGATGELTFFIRNIGTIPIRVSNISFTLNPDDDPPGVGYVLSTPGVIGAQLHPGESISAGVDITVNSPGSYTLAVTVDAVPWNTY